MAILEIPEEVRPGIVLIRDLHQDAFAALVIALEHSPTRAPVVEGVASEDAGQILDAVKSMYTIRVYSEVSVEKFVSDICDAMREYNLLNSRDEPTLKERLTRLLDIEPLNVWAKAVLLRLEHEHRFCTARILTDARPVYGTDVSASPVAIVINHTLKITYHEGEAGDTRDIYIALRPRDLEEMRDLIQRAADKEKSLVTALGPTNITVINGSKD